MIKEALASWLRKQHQGRAGCLHPLGEARQESIPVSHPTPLVRINSHSLKRSV